MTEHSEKNYALGHTFLFLFYFTIHCSELIE